MGLNRLDQLPSKTAPLGIRILLRFQISRKRLCSCMLGYDKNGTNQKSGLMDQALLYWDDIEWFDRIRQDGHRVVAYERSKAWHKMGVKKNKHFRHLILSKK